MNKYRQRSKKQAIKCYKSAIILNKDSEIVKFIENLRNDLDKEVIISVNMIRGI